MNFYALLLAAPLLVGGLTLLTYVFVKQTSDFLRRRIILVIIGYVLLGCTILFRNDYFNDLIGPYMYLVSTIGGILGFGLIGFGFSAFSTFSDLKWKEKLRELFIISKNGICLFAFSFEKSSILKDSDLIAGGLSGIQLLLSEITKTDENMHCIDYQNLKIMLEQTADALFVLFIKEESSFLVYKLKFFSQEFQTFFKDALENWKGDIDAFKPTSILIQRVFELKI